MLSSLSVATLQVLEAVAHWRGVMGNARLVPVWNEADYLRKLQRDTHFLLRHRLLDALAISGHTGAVLPFVDALASSHGVARLAEGSALQQPAAAPTRAVPGGRTRMTDEPRTETGHRFCWLTNNPEIQLFRD